jgi:DNA invertase Pin-like site-specific DNA recombinase
MLAIRACLDYTKRHEKSCHCTRRVARRHAVIYARVSSKEQEKEGFSIPAQLKLLKEYAVVSGFTVVEEYIDVETAKQVGRAAFGEMVAYLKAHPSVRVMLVEKTDRLYRNLKDWVTVDELDVEMHFPKEGVVLSRESRSSEKFMHGIKVLMAKNYIDNLSEEARKGKRKPNRASGRPRRRSVIATSPARMARRLSRPIRRCRRSWRVYSNGMRGATFR